MRLCEGAHKRDRLKSDIEIDRLIERERERESVCVSVLKRVVGVNWNAYKNSSRHLFIIKWSYLYTVKLSLAIKVTNLIIFYFHVWETRLFNEPKKTMIGKKREKKKK